MCGGGSAIGMLDNHEKLPDLAMSECVIRPSLTRVQP